MRTLLTASLFVLVGTVAEVPVFATSQFQVPEVSPGTMSAGLAALAAGVLVVRARWRSK